MGLYRKEDTVVTSGISTAPITREDIIQYQQNLDYYKGQAAQDRQELDVKMQELRDAQYEYQKDIRSQGDKIRQLTELVLALTNQVNKLQGA